MAACGTCVKYLLFVFNFLLWLFGCALFSVGIWLRSDPSGGHYVDKLTDKLDEKYQISYSATGEEDVTGTISVILIIAGLVVIFITFLGCCGAIRQNTCLLGAFAISLLALTITMLGIGIWACVKRSDLNAETDDLREKTDGIIDYSLKTYFTDPKSKDFMSTVQDKFHCCGGDNYEKDYRGSAIPATCRVNRGRNCKLYYFDFVAKEIEAFLKDRLLVIAAIALTFGGCMALGLILTLLMYFYVKRSSSVRVN